MVEAAAEKGELVDGCSRINDDSDILNEHIIKER